MSFASINPFHLCTWKVKSCHPDCIEQNHQGITLSVYYSRVCYKYVYVDTIEDETREKIKRKVVKELNSLAEPCKCGR